MKISGFSFVRDGVSLYYPVAESIRSILPICDEFVVAVGQGSAGDRTREVIEEINDPKVKIIDTVWNEKDFQHGAINARQTDIAMQACAGDWLFYLQADEVVHEKYLPVIHARLEELLHDLEVEGLLFSYKHFWGDYLHYIESHSWYSREIRIVRNVPQIHSWHSAQSFRYYDRYEHPWQKDGTRKLRAAVVDAEVFHYGWVRPPQLMQKKNKALFLLHRGAKSAEEAFRQAPAEFSYGDLSKLPVYRDTHPAVMAGMISRMNWADRLAVQPKRWFHSSSFKHETLKDKAITWVEKHLHGGEQLFRRKNYVLVNR
ncbi:MAG TPA: glycosyltransferase [Oligoflexia bacterium]|nr:glycosyltransferase [Oligoflexia bacterium]